MKNAIHYFNQNSSGMIIAGQKDGSDELGVFYAGTHHELKILRELINESIDLLLQQPKSLEDENDIYA